MEEFEKMAQLEFEDMEPVAEGETTDDVIEIQRSTEDPDEPSNRPPRRRRRRNQSPQRPRLLRLPPGAGRNRDCPQWLNQQRPEANEPELIDALGTTPEARIEDPIGDVADGEAGTALDPQSSIGAEKEAEIAAVENGP